MSTPLTLFSAMTPLYEDSVKLGASFTLTTVIVTLAFAVSPSKKTKALFKRLVADPGGLYCNTDVFLITEETRKKPFYQVKNIFDFITFL